MNRRTRRPARRAEPRREGPGQPQKKGDQSIAEAGSGPQLTSLDPRLILWPELRITSQYRDEERAALSRSIQEQGQQQPVGVYLVDGQYVGADGQNRCLDAIERGESVILCMVRSGTERDVLQSNIATALLRGHTNPLAVAEVFWQAYNEQGMEVDELAGASGRSAEWVEKMLRVSQASPVVKQMLGDEMISMGHAEILSRVEDHDKQETALTQVLQNRWTVAELEEYLFGAPKTEEPGSSGQRAPAVRNPRACTICHTEQQQGTIQTLHVCDICVTRIGKMDALGEQRLIDAIRDALPELREAEHLLAQSPASVSVAERIGTLVELLEREGRPLIAAAKTEEP